MPARRRDALDVEVGVGRRPRRSSASVASSTRASICARFALVGSGRRDRVAMAQPYARLDTVSNMVFNRRTRPRRFRRTLDDQTSSTSPRRATSARSPTSPSSPSVTLMTPQQLYELWERQNWQSQTIDFTKDQRGLGGAGPTSSASNMAWNLSSFFVGEERVTTQFTGLVMAYENQSEEAFLTTQQVDEARHAQHFNRFYEQVARRSTGRSRTACERAREDLNEAFIELFDERPRRRGQAPDRRPARHRGQGRLRDDLPHGHRGHARAHRPVLPHRLLRAARRSCPASSRASATSRRTSTATSPTARGSCREKARTRRSRARIAGQARRAAPGRRRRARPAGQQTRRRLRDPRLLAPRRSNDVRLHRADAAPEGDRRRAPGGGRGVSSWTPLTVSALDLRELRDDLRPRRGRSRRRDRAGHGLRGHPGRLVLPGVRRAQARLRARTTARPSRPGLHRLDALALERAGAGDVRAPPRVGADGLLARARLGGGHPRPRQLVVDGRGVGQVVVLEQRRRVVQELRVQRAEQRPAGAGLDDERAQAAQRRGQALAEALGPGRERPPRSRPPRRGPSAPPSPAASARRRACCRPRRARPPRWPRRGSGSADGKSITQVPWRLGAGNACELRARASAGSEQRWMSSRSLSAMKATPSASS